MIKKYLPFILLALGAGLIVYMHYTHNNGCCGHTHKHSSNNQHHSCKTDKHSSCPDVTADKSHEHGHEGHSHD